MKIDIYKMNLIFFPLLEKDINLCSCIFLCFFAALLETHCVLSH